MATKDTDQNPFNETVTFIQHDLPGLDAGSYQLTVEQQIFQHDGTTVISPQPYSNTYSFGVFGDRFSLKTPGSLIESVFPSDNSTGEFSNILPHVVFKKTTFPWIRFPNNELPYAPPAPGTDVDVDVPTWLWVMVLDEDDTDDYHGLQLTPANRTVGDLFSQQLVPGSSLLPGNFSTLSSSKKLSVLEAGQNTADNIQTIDIPLSLFWELAPSLGTESAHGDLYWGAHVRKVDLTNQPRSNSAPPAEPTGKYSIVVGNRFPAEMKKNYAYLVSLEWLEDYLPLPGGLPPPPPPGVTFGPGASIRLTVLKAWSFFSTTESALFVHKLESLNESGPGGFQALNTNLRLDYIGTNPVVSAAINMGYAPMNETMRNAEKNVSWYRGPLVPYANNVAVIKTPVTSPDAAMVFDPTTGMLDVSYAAAWTIGRLVALQDASFSTALYNWKKKLVAQVNDQVQNKMIMKQFTDDQAAPETMKPVAITQNSIFKKTVLSLKK